MKLNNHGWGSREMIIYSSILLFFFLLAVVMIKYFYRELVFVDSSPVEKVENNVENKQPVVFDVSYYERYEGTMKNAAIDYWETTVNMDNVTYTSISIEQLVELGYLEYLYDMKTDKVCNGYVNISKDNNGDLDVQSYLKCDNYMTTGY